MAAIRRFALANAAAWRTAQSPAPVRRLGVALLAALILAQIGACIAFGPLLQILAPLKAGAIAPNHKAALLSQVLFAGAITATVANLLAGIASDRTRTWFGRRSWMMVGLIGALGAYVMMARASTRWQLFLAIIVFQLLFNVFYAAFAAAVAERTPDARRGLVYSLMAMGPAVGSIAGLFVVGDLARGETTVYAVLALMIVATIAPFIVLFRDAPPPARSIRGTHAAPPRPALTPDFLLVIASRVATVTAQMILQGFALFALEDRWSHLQGAPAAFRPNQAMANLLIAVTGANLAAGLVCGWLSDRLGWRKRFIVISTLVSGAAIAVCGVSGAWPVVVVAFIIFGGANGCYNAVGSALMVQVLPSLDNAGRDLGIVNFSNTLPQALAPLIAVFVMQGHSFPYARLFLVAGALAALGGATILPVKSVR